MNTITLKKEDLERLRASGYVDNEDMAKIEYKSGAVSSQSLFKTIPIEDYIFFMFHLLKVEKINLETLALKCAKMGCKIFAITSKNKIIERLTETAEAFSRGSVSREELNLQIKKVSDWRKQMKRTALPSELAAASCAYSAACAVETKEFYGYFFAVRDTFIAINNNPYHYMMAPPSQRLKVAKAASYEMLVGHATINENLRAEFRTLVEEFIK
tara:strand:+ start:50 stop:691 length:642 start_codon:yes stop_codon:yes gene_type:complete